MCMRIIFTNSSEPVNLYFILCCMIFMHIVDDYYLQGILASLKQKKWWEKNAPNEMYRHDYLVGLLMHSFSWSFMISLPLVIENKEFVGITYVIILTINSIIHALTDDAKANKIKINLIQDQTIHMIQIVVTWMFVSGGMKR